MSAEEKDKIEQQHESIKNIENAIRYVITPKQLFGLAVSCFTCACVIVGAFYSAKNYFQGKDESVTVQFAKMNARMDAKDKKDSLNTISILAKISSFKKEDSIDKLALKHEADSNKCNIAIIQKQCKSIDRRTIGYVMVKKSGPNGPITFEPVTSKNSQINK